MDVPKMNELSTRLQNLDPNSVDKLTHLLDIIKEIDTAAEPALPILDKILTSLGAINPAFLKLKEVVDVMGKLNGPVITTLEKMIALVEKMK